MASCLKEAEKLKQATSRKDTMLQWRTVILPLPNKNSTAESASLPVSGVDLDMYSGTEAQKHIYLF